MTELEAAFLALALGSQIIAYLCIRQSRRLLRLMREDGNTKELREQVIAWRTSNSRWRDRALKAEGHYPERAPG